MAIEDAQTKTPNRMILLKESFQLFDELGLNLRVDD